MICTNFNPHITDEGAGVIERSHDSKEFSHLEVLQIPAHFWQWHQMKEYNRDQPAGNENTGPLHQASTFAGHAEGTRINNGSSLVLIHVARLLFPT